jgi:hypothetical protein
VLPLEEKMEVFKERKNYILKLPGPVVRMNLLLVKL